MSTRNDILNQLKEDLKNTITVANGYKMDVVDVRRGIFLPEDIPDRPVIAFWCYGDNVIEHLMNRRQLRVLLVYVYFYERMDGAGGVDSIHELGDAVETFLFSDDWTYKSSTLVGDMTIYEGGVQDPESIGELELEIKYYRQ